MRSPPPRGLKRFFDEVSTWEELVSIFSNVPYFPLKASRQIIHQNSSSDFYILRRIIRLTDNPSGRIVRLYNTYKFGQFRKYAQRKNHSKPCYDAEDRKSSKCLLQSQFQYQRNNLRYVTEVTCMPTDSKTWINEQKTRIVQSNCRDLLPIYRFPIPRDSFRWSKYTKLFKNIICCREKWSKYFINWRNNDDWWLIKIINSKNKKKANEI